MPFKITCSSAYQDYSSLLEQQQRKFVELVEHCRKSLTPEGLADEHLFSLVCDLLTEKNLRKALVQRTFYDDFLETLENEIGFDIIKLAADLNAKRCFDLPHFSANLPLISKQRDECQRLHEQLLQHMTALHAGLSELKSSLEKINNFHEFEAFSLSAQLESRPLNSDIYRKFSWFYSHRSYYTFSGYYPNLNMTWKNGHMHGGDSNTLSAHLSRLRGKSQTAMKHGGLIEWGQKYDWRGDLQPYHVYAPDVEDLEARQLAAQEIPAVEEEMKRIAACVAEVKTKCARYSVLYPIVKSWLSKMKVLKKRLEKLQQWKVSDGDKRQEILKIYNEYKSFLGDIDFKTIDIKNDLQTFAYKGAKDFFEYLQGHYAAMKAILKNCLANYPDDAIFLLLPATVLAAQALQTTIAIPLQLEGLTEEEKASCVDSYADGVIELTELRDASAALRALKREDIAYEIKKDAGDGIMPIVARGPG